MPDADADATDTIMNGPPIPTYEEAVSTAGESSRLLGGGGGSSSRRNNITRADGYRPPTVESVRSSMDSSFLSDFASDDDDETNSLHREMVQMEVMDADDPDSARRRRRLAGGFRESLNKHLSGIRVRLPTLPSLPRLPRPRNPFRGLFEGISISRPRMPSIPLCQNAAAYVPLYRLLAIVIALMVLYAIFASDALNMSSRLPTEYAGQFMPADVRRYAAKSIDYHKIDHWMEYLSSFNHMAGTQGDFVLANYVEAKFGEFKLGSKRQEYKVYLNYPKAEGRRVYMKDPEWTAKMEETVLDKDRENTLVFHGLSKSGKANGPLIYANFGGKGDFGKLAEMGVEVKGAVVLMRYGGAEKDPGLKCKAAQEAGAVGCILYSDPVAEGWRWPEDAVRRHGVGLRNEVPGDVLTPGWASTNSANRLNIEDSPGVLKIPSLPLSWNDARHLLKALEGRGQKAPDDWPSGVPEIKEYWTGSKDKSPEVFLENELVEEPLQPIWNVFGTVPGIDVRDQRLIIGTHRDSWCFGASNPNSGTAVMLEVARVLGTMMDLGWRPHRTIQFASWDASTYNLIGSTEWMEDQDDSVRGSTLAYINIDAAVTGTHFTAGGSPHFKTILDEILSNIPDPIRHNSPVSDHWRTGLGPLGTAGDYVPFQHHNGIPSLDLSFRGNVVPEHSCYDNYASIKRKDPDMQYHMTLAKILILLILELADTPIAPFNMTEYSHALTRYTTELHGWMQKMDTEGKVDLGPLDRAVDTAKGYIDTFETIFERWMETDPDGIYVANDDWSVALRRARSMRMSNFEKHLADTSEGGGVPGREWWRGMVHGPGRDRSESWSFPGVREAVEKGEWERAGEEVVKVAGLVERAGRKMLDELS